MRELIEFLCSPTCNGREPGTPGGVAARDRIARELEAARLQPLGDQGGWLQTVPRCGHNVVGRVPGQGPLAARAIVVGAHFDHLGADGRRVYWGADDNAAAVAILVDVARALAANPPGGRQVIVCAFDGEEPPHFLTQTMGSMGWVKHPPVPLASIDAMVCMDLVGHAVGGPRFPEAVRRSLFVLGAERSPGTARLVDGVAARAEGVVPRRLNMDVVPPMSDYHAFEQAGVASIFLTCGRWEHYHQPTDTPDRLDYPKIAATARFLEDLTRALATRPDAPVRHDPRARDDAATLRSLREVGQLLLPVVPQVALALPALTALERSAARGPLSPAEQTTLRVLVGQLESVLA